MTNETKRPFHSTTAFLRLARLALISLVLCSCVTTSKFDEEAIRGVASWYGARHHGRKTASGEIFDMNQLTAAHRTLPFGTVVHVRNVRNSKMVRVRINDRGPFTKGRIIDLSREAAKQLDMIASGQEEVEVFIER